jgi:hypothetical protein
MVEQQENYLQNSWAEVAKSLTAFEKSIQLRQSIKIGEHGYHFGSKSNTRLLPGKKGAKGHNIAPSGNSCW